MTSTRVERPRAMATSELATTTAGRFVAIGAVVVASVLFGSNAVFAKLSYDDGVAVFALVWMRYLLPLVVLGPLAVSQRRRDPAPLPLREIRDDRCRIVTERR